LEKKLREAGKKWFALSPRWATEKHNTEHSVVFWLNPMEQRTNNSGLYTVEELLLWAENKGPIVRSKPRSF
jgi:hypothetical protein